MISEEDSGRHYAIAYWKKRWIGVLLLPSFQKYVSEDGCLHRFKLVPLDGSVIEPSPTRDDCYDRVKVQGIVDISAWSEQDLKKLCQMNGVALPWITDRFPREPFHKQETPHRHKDRKVFVLSKDQFQKVKKQLIQSHPQIALILRILWFLNNSIGKGGGLITLAEVLYLQVRNVDPSGPDSSQMISLYRDSYGSHLLVHDLPPHLWSGVEKQITGRSPFVFVTRHGGPLSTTQVNRVLKEAAKAAGIARWEEVSSLSLRTRYSAEEAKQCDIDAAVASPLAAILEEEWQGVCKQFPSLLQRKGRKAAYEPREVLNLILESRRSRRPLRKVTAGTTIPYEAVKSQWRRWMKADLVEQIIAFRKKNRSI